MEIDKQKEWAWCMDYLRRVNKPPSQEYWWNLAKEKYRNSEEFLNLNNQ